jgi:hypothetical protein
MTVARATADRQGREGNQMVANVDDSDGDDCSKCPRCQLRQGITNVMLDEDGELRQQLLDQLLDTVERLRAAEVAETDDAEEIAEEAALEVLDLMDCIIALGKEDAPPS